MKFRVVFLFVFCVLSLLAIADSPVVFNEILYHPATNESQLEWVELQNQMAVDVDISNWRLDGGISFRFPGGTVIRAGEYLVVAASPSTLSAATGLSNVSGPFTDRLSNGGEQLRLRNNNNRVMDEITYGVEGDWPVAPDGAGPSLARRRANVRGSDSRNWLASTQLGGTPGAENFPAAPSTNSVAFNELTSSTNAAFWVELINHGSTNVDLGGWIIARMGGATNREYVLPARVLAPGQLLEITKIEMGFGADSGDRLVLYTTGRSNVADAVVAKKDPRGRSPDGTGAWWFPNQPTPGASNSFAFRNELVINEIMFHAPELPANPGTFSPTNVVVTISNLWKFHAEGLDLGTEWRAPAYDDSAWSTSNAIFYAPPGLLLPAPKNTFQPVTNSAGERIITFYFRTQFTFSGNTNGLMLALRPLIDDGAIFYLNGAEVYRLNMPATNITYGTLATVNVVTPNFVGPVLIPANGIVQGVNTLAVEVHKVSNVASDFCFGTELLAFEQLAPPLPFRDSPQSWVELFNRSSNTVDLTGWRLDEGIDYRFTPGKTITPGTYLVVAKDVGYMRSLYPALDVVGPFTNRLSGRSDYIVLKDASNNIADEVRYFGGGHWPRYADGGGSSLELRDLRANNTRAEAWEASDETGKSQWQTFTWRGVCAPGQAGEPTLWREFALCLLDGAGEALIDDISVIETPATAPRQLIAKGGFDGGSTARWRFLGNHRHSRIEPEPGNPGNYVLHLVATGPGEYQWNQLEMTLTNNTPVVDGREYEISYRARWLAGRSKLNARLYFNRLARTFDLAVPMRNGTPGAINSRFVPNIGPTFSELAHKPVVPNPNQPVIVSVTVSDPDGIASLVLKYSVAGGAWQSVPMVADGAATLPQFSGTIPEQTGSSLVQFYVEGADALGATSFYPARGMNSRALYVVQDNQAVSGPQHKFRILMPTADAVFMHTSTNALSNELLGSTVIYNESEVFYDVGVRLKGSFVGRNAARVGFHIAFNTEQPFRGVHEVISVDRAQQGLIGGVAEVIAKHIANYAGGIASMHDDLARFVAPLPSYSGTCQLRFSGYDSDYLDAQFQNGSEGSMFEIEVLRWLLATVDGRPESIKQVGNESGGTAFLIQEVQNYGDNKENYRWMFLNVNRRTADDYAEVINVAKTFSLSGANFDVQAAQLLDVEQWLRMMAYQQLVNPFDVYFTGANIHNFRLYVRPADGKVLYLPWDWDSVFLRVPGETIFGTGNIAKLIANPNNRRSYLNHIFDILNTTYNTNYMTGWATHYGAVAGQDVTNILNHINTRARIVLNQLPTGAAFTVTNNGGGSFGTSNSTIIIGGAAPIQVKTIEVNGIPYPITWSSATNWTLSVPLGEGANILAVQGLDNSGIVVRNAAVNLTVTNTGPSALQPVVINEWMADNAGPDGFPDPADGLFQDWLELFNPNTSAVNLSGYYLTDNLSQPTKWRIPSNILIPARGFLLVWADNETNQNTGLPGSDLHAGFQLNAGGEAIGLFTANGVTPQFTAVFDQQVQNISQGFFPDGDTNTVVSMTNFTPRAANVLSGPLRIGQISINGTTVTLSWSTIPGRTYRVEYKDDLSAPAWNPLGDTIQTFGNTASVDDTVSVTANRFYRLLRVD